MPLRSYAPRGEKRPLVLAALRTEPVGTKAYTIGCTAGVKERFVWRIFREEQVQCVFTTRAERELLARVRAGRSLAGL